MHNALLLPLVQLIACLALTASANAQTRVEAKSLGNPFLEYWPTKPYARNIWDMEVFDGRLYLGAGNSSNIGPSQNAGPVPIISYGADGFRREFLVDEEQVTTFYLVGSRLYVPGHDSRESWAFGNLYRRDQFGWAKLRTVQHGVHVYDVHQVRDQLIAAGGAYSQPLDAWISRNEGATWRSPRLLSNPAFTTRANPTGSFTRLSGDTRYGRFYSLFELGGALYASSSAPLAQPGAEDRPVIATLFAFDGDDGFRPVAIDPATAPADQRRVFQASSVELFPGVARTNSAEEPRIPVVQRDVKVGKRTAYIGGWVHNDHQWLPFGLFVAASADSVRSIELPDGFQPYDLLVQGDRVLALVNRTAISGRTTVGVMRSEGSRLDAWQLIFTFDAPTFARSFAFYNGDFYFGLGTEVSHPALEGEAAEFAWGRELAASAGEVLRVSGGEFR